MLTDKQLEIYLPRYEYTRGVYTIQTDSHEPGDPYSLPSVLAEKVKDLISSLGNYYQRYLETIGDRLNVLVDLTCIGYLDKPKDIGYTRLQIDSFLKEVGCLTFKEFVQGVVSVDKEHDYLDLSLYSLILYKYAHPQRVAFLEDTYMFDPYQMDYTSEDVNSLLDGIFAAASLNQAASIFNNVEII